MDAEDLLYLLYTSGTTAKPKGIMHSTGGYLTQVAFTHRAVFDLHPERDVYWCAADIGWVTGHSYIVYGPLANGATSVMYEGTPDFPDKDRWWDIIERYGVTHPVLRAHRHPDLHEVGHRVPRAPRHVVAAGARLGGRAHQPRGVDLVLDPHRRRALPGGRHVVADRDRRHHDLPPARGSRPASPVRPPSRCPGIGAEVVDDAGKPVERGGGYLTLTRPWPSMLRGIYGDPERYRETYWSRFEGRYFAGDGAKIDDDGYFWLLGRVDDVMNVSGHRISTTEVESALVDHPSVAEAAVVGAKDDTTGQAIIAFVTLKAGQEQTDERGRGAARPRGPPHRAHRPAQDGDLHRRAAQDPLGQDHAPAAARRGRGPRPG